MGKESSQSERLRRSEEWHDEVEHVPHRGVTREGVVKKKSIDTKAGVTWEDRTLVLTADRLLVAKSKVPRLEALVEVA